jgi:imidazolonepropionase-like amidohydrolase
MNARIKRTLLILAALIINTLVASTPLRAQSQAQTPSTQTPSESSNNPRIAVLADTIYTMSGQPITAGVVLINNGKIERVGVARDTPIPVNYRKISARVVTPGLIDAHTVVGLAGYLNQPHDQDQVERSTAMQPELRAIDAYNAREELVTWLRQHGITTIHTGHGTGSLISGGTMIAKTSGDTAEEAVIVADAMIAVTLGSEAFAAGGRAPGTRAKQISLLRQELIRAGDFIAKQARDAGGNKTGNNNSTSNNSSQTAGQSSTPPTRDLKQEAMARVMRRETPLLITAHRAQDIMSALRLAREFNIRIVLDGASESYLLTNEIKAANVPVIVHPTMYRASDETENLSMETPATLRRAGIPVALQSGFEGYVPKTRVVLFEAAVAAANGLSAQEALALVTIDAARLLGIERRTGSLEAGKDADLALFDGDPFEYTSHVIGVIINGRIVSEVKR